MAPITSLAVRPREAIFCGIEPDAHGVVAAAEHHRLAHAGDPRDPVLDLEDGIVPEVELVVPPVGDSMCTTMMKLGELFTVVTPSWRTSSGSRGRAWLTRFWTWICARSRSVPILKVTVRVSTPSAVAWDDM